MANQEHYEILRQGVMTWNQWRKELIEIRPNLTRAKLGGAKLGGAALSNVDLSNVDLRHNELSNVDLSYAYLSGADLSGANLSGANLRGASFQEAILYDANLSGANLRGAKFIGAALTGATLSGANLSSANLSVATLIRANLSGANLNHAELTGTKLQAANLSGATLNYADLEGVDLTRADLTRADLTGARLETSVLVETDLSGATLTQCSVYGVSVWNVQLEGAKQESLVITPTNESTVTVDNLKVAQFIYLLLNNREIRDVIDTIGQKGVLILGRFSNERKQVLDALREKLRELNYLPMVFDFERPTERDFTETIMTLAGLCRFIIADITNPKSSPLELHATVPNYMIPFVPIIQEGEEPFSMLQDLQRKYNWVLDTLEYDTSDNLINALEKAIVEPALIKHKELMAKKVEQLSTRQIKDYS
jgi:uncharacterized protein YjbI with pentapeptide repeats